MQEVRGASFAESWSPFLGRERATVGVDVDPEQADANIRQLSGFGPLSALRVSLSLRK